MMRKSEKDAEVFIKSNSFSTIRGVYFNKKAKANEREN